MKSVCPEESLSAVINNVVIVFHGVKNDAVSYICFDCSHIQSWFSATSLKSCVQQAHKGNLWETERYHVSLVKLQGYDPSHQSCAWCVFCMCTRTRKRRGSEISCLCVHEEVLPQSGFPSRTRVSNPGPAALLSCLFYLTFCSETTESDEDVIMNSTERMMAKKNNLFLKMKLMLFTDVVLIDLPASRWTLMWKPWMKLNPASVGVHSPRRLWIPVWLEPPLSQHCPFSCSV